MIKPINMNLSTFRANKIDMPEEKNEYVDPLMKWPLRGAAFTNEVGEALRPLIGEYATLSWVPALLYFGADIYDKYKNDQMQYNPDSHRCLKQAIFQGTASILLPICAVKLGQGAFSLFGMATKDKLTIKTKEHINSIAQEFVANGKMRAYDNKDKECVKEFLDIVSNSLDYKKQEEAARPIKRIRLKIEEVLTNILKINPKQKIDEYATTTINKLIKLRKDLLNPTETFKESNHYNNYLISLENGQTKNVAVKSSLNKYLESRTIKGKMVKTVGGFIALGLAIRPIDYFVDKVIIEKWISPNLEKRKKAV